MLQGFKDFITRGNVMDLAVGVIIGAAFGKIVDALVNSVLMPAIARVFGTPSFDDFLAFGDIKFGVLLTAIVNFLLIALAVYFALVLPMNKLAERKAAKEGITEEEAVDPQLELLTQIRDELKANRGA
ncbi:large conductance mechanosensitive channel protein MscL [Galactobacter valiniphilus]|uniref:Large-conductance mechanosensitive channel n=1 Tax=Galactobacter valiniphilus TaxID=2676122 RepID=A0A399JGY3_9MICC|nr:large conductance mechanosensitive channel protein MscL [Galactobacter valiniphilus]RII43432.1 large conductance mechanosensitive channel protein MscL [Galactobacter valiniphilus]